jgi:hypothetical protein
LGVDRRALLLNLLVFSYFGEHSNPEPSGYEERADTEDRKTKLAART